MLCMRVLSVDVNINPEIILQLSISDSFIGVECITVEIHRNHPLFPDPPRLPERANYLRDFGILYGCQCLYHSPLPARRKIE